MAHIHGYGSRTGTIIVPITMGDLTHESQCVTTISTIVTVMVTVTVIVTIKEQLGLPKVSVR